MTGSNDWDHGFLVILNRSAVRISEKNYVPNGMQRIAPAGANPPPLTMADARHKMTAAAKHSTDVDYQVRAEP